MLKKIEINIYTKKKHNINDLKMFLFTDTYDHNEFFSMLWLCMYVCSLLQKTSYSSLRCSIKFLTETRDDNKISTIV